MQRQRTERQKGEPNNAFHGTFSGGTVIVKNKFASGRWVQSFSSLKSQNDSIKLPSEGWN
jgi:hypothetical protein